MELPAGLLAEHDQDDGEVAEDAAHHAEDVHAEVEAELGHSGPGVSHRLGGLIANYNITRRSILGSDCMTLISML